MNYANTPACRLLATHCACCGRPLLDAKSVEFGIGPDCRVRYGFDEVPNKPDWYAGKTIAANYDPTLPVASWTDARIACNALVKMFALDTEGRKWAPEAVFALGYVALSEKMAQRGGRVEVKSDLLGFTVKTPSSHAWRCCRTIPGRQENWRDRSWTIPMSSRPQLWTAIRRYFAGRLLVTAQGVSTIPHL